MKVFPILGLCVFSSTLGIGIVSPLLPLYVKDMGASGVWLGIIVAAYFASNSIATPIAGRLSDRRGRKVFLTVGLVFYSLISLGYVFAHTPAHLALVRLVQGLAGAITIPIAMAYLGDLAPEGKEGKWMGYANATFFSGFGFGPLMGGVLTDHFGMTVTFLTMGGLNLLAAIIAFFFLPEVSRKKIDGNVPLLSFKELSSNVVRGLFSFRLVQALGSGGISAFLPIFAASLGLSTSLIGILLTVNILSVTAVMPLGGFIADRFSRKTLTAIGGTLGAILLVAITLTGSFSPLLVVLIVQGIGVALSMPAAAALMVEEGRKFGMGSTMSIFYLAMGLGMALGPIISGGIADAFEINWVFYFGSIMGLIGTGFFLWFTRGFRG